MKIQIGVRREWDETDKVKGLSLNSKSWGLTWKTETGECSVIKTIREFGFRKWNRKLVNEWETATWKCNPIAKSVKSLSSTF